MLANAEFISSWRTEKLQDYGMGNHITISRRLLTTDKAVQCTKQCRCYTYRLRWMLRYESYLTYHLSHILYVACNYSRMVFETGDKVKWINSFVCRRSGRWNRCMSRRFGKPLAMQRLISWEWLDALWYRQLGCWLWGNVSTWNLYKYQVNWPLKRNSPNYDVI